MSVLLVEPRDGLHISKDLPKLGYRGVEACGLVFERMKSPPLPCSVGATVGTQLIARNPIT